MARIRTIKPEFPQSESMGRVSRDARLCFIMIWTICDDAGRVRGNSRMLASLLYPYDDDAPTLMEGWLLELEREGCIRRYRIGTDTYLESLNWLKHQKIDRPSDSRLPAFDEASRSLANDLEPSATDLVPSTLVPSTMDLVSSTAPTAIFSEGFNSFWEVFPRKDGSKVAASKAFIATKAKPDIIIAGAKAYALTEEATKDDGKFSVGAIRWLQEKRWLDQPKIPTPEEIAANMERADKIMRRGKYAETYS